MALLDRFRRKAMSTQWDDEDGDVGRSDGMGHYIEWVPTEHLRPMLEWDRDENGIPGRTDEVLDSLNRVGFKNPVWVDFNDQTNKAHVSEGNHRLTVALRAGIPAVPVSVIRSGRVPRNQSILRPYKYVGDEVDPYDPTYVPQYMKPSEIGMPTTEPWTPPKTSARIAMPIVPINWDILNQPREQYVGKYPEFADKEQFAYSSPEYQAWLEKMHPEFEATRQREKDWDRAARHAMAVGRMTPEQVTSLGYRPISHEGDGDWGAPAWGKWRPLPPKLYHATTNLPAVLQSGVLRSPHELDLMGLGRGLGGGTQDTISLTDSLDEAQNMKRAMIEGADVASGRLPIERLVEMAKTGEGADKPWLEGIFGTHDWSKGNPQGLDDLLLGRKPFYNHLLPEGHPLKGMESWQSHLPEEEWAKHGYHPRDDAYALGTPGNPDYPRYTAQSVYRNLTPEEKALEAFEWWRNPWAPFRSWAGGPSDPMFTGIDPHWFANLDPSHVGVVEAEPVHGAHGYPLSSLGEWRIPTGEAVNIVGHDGQDTQRMGSKTRQQRLLDAQQFDDTSEVVHTFPDGWTVRRPTKYGDLAREGYLMSNCWDLSHPDNPWYMDLPEGTTVGYNDPLPDDTAHSLRDPDNLPHVSFFYHPPHEGFTGGLGEALGQHNSSPKERYHGYLRGYAEAQGLDPDFAVAPLNPYRDESEEFDGERAASAEPQRSWHLTDKHDFALDPEYAPTDNALSIDDRSGRKGLYVGDAERWFNGHNYVRPFVAEIEHPADAPHGRWDGERFIPAEMYPQTRVRRVIPYSQYQKETFGGSFDKGLDAPEGDVRQWTPEQVAAYKQQVNEFIKTERPHMLQSVCERCASDYVSPGKPCPKCGFETDWDGNFYSRTASFPGPEYLVPGQRYVWWSPQSEQWRQTGEPRNFNPSPHITWATYLGPHRHEDYQRAAPEIPEGHAFQITQGGYDGRTKMVRGTKGDPEDRASQWENVHVMDDAQLRDAMEHGAFGIDYPPSPMFLDQINMQAEDQANRDRDAQPMTMPEDWSREGSAPDNRSYGAASPSLMYHLAPNEFRASIAENGLDFSKGESGSDYDHPSFVNEPGNYLWPSVEKARAWLRTLPPEHNWDLWEVDPGDIPLKRDNYDYSASYTTAPVPPDRVRLHTPYDAREASASDKGPSVAPDEVVEHMRALHKGTRGRSRVDNDIWWERVARRIHQYPAWTRTQYPVDQFPAFDVDADRMQALDQMPGPMPEVVIDHDGEVIDGWHRVTLAQRRGDTHVPAFTPAPDHEPRRSVESGETLPAELRRWDMIRSMHRDVLADSEDEPDYSRDDLSPPVLHTFPDGWTVQHHHTLGAAQNVGSFMRNCWQDRQIAWSAAPGYKRAQFAALHDEHGLPRAAFYWHPQRRIITAPLGMRNDPLTPDLEARLEAFKQVAPDDGRYGADGDDDQWSDEPDFMQGDCADYAHAMLDARPDLRLGTHMHEGTPFHVFAHDDHHAYDASGRHPLPYRYAGLDAVYDRDRDILTNEFGVDHDPEDYRYGQAQRHLAESKLFDSREANILDPVELTLDPAVFDQPEAPRPRLKPAQREWLLDTIYNILEQGGYEGADRWARLYLTGSLTTYQYAGHSDCDISIFVNHHVFPEWSRAEMIGLMVEHCDGLTLPGTPHELQVFVVAKGIEPEDLYQRGLRSGYDLINEEWVVPPERERTHDVEHEDPEGYATGLLAADKMERLLRYEPDKAITYYGQLHRKRMRDQKDAKGDFAGSNLIYKMLANRGLFDRLRELGVKIAANEPPDDDFNLDAIVNQSEGSRDSSREFAGGWQGTVYHGARDEEARQAILANGFDPAQNAWTRRHSRNTIFFAHTPDGAKYGPRIKAQVTLKRPMVFWWDPEAEPRTKNPVDPDRRGEMRSDPPEAAALNWSGGDLAELAKRTGHDGAIYPRRDEMQVFDPSAVTNIEAYDEPPR